MADSTGQHPPSDRPAILIVCHALSGHLAPLLLISTALRQLDWPIIAFLGPTRHKARIEASGARFLPLTRDADLDDKAYYESPPVTGYTALHWTERAKIDLRAQCIEPLPTQWDDFKSALQALHDEARPGRQVLVVAEALFLGILPLKYGAPLPKAIKHPPKTLCISVTVPLLRSIDLPPFAHPGVFDQSAEGRARNHRKWETWADEARQLTDLLDAKLQEAGATRTIDEPILAGANYTCHARVVQLGVPGFEYPRSDLPAAFRFGGLVQGRRRRRRRRRPQGSVDDEDEDDDDPPFDWWAELKANSALPPSHGDRKKVVVVAQGTVETNPHDLIIPTLLALRDSLDEVMVVAILGWKDATLDTPLPANARIADYLSYDAVLAHADLWVHNGGFGAVSHGIANGVPMVVAGEGMDKTENAARVAWSGIGVDLRTARPAAHLVRAAVERVLGDAAFGERVRALRAESEAVDCFGVIHEELLGLVDG